MARKASTSARGYGHAHQQARRRALQAMDDGAPCARCGGAMHRGQALDLDHTDDRSDYGGLAHARCNRSAGAVKRHANAGHKIRSSQPAPSVHSRRW